MMEKDKRCRMEEFHNTAVARLEKQRDDFQVMLLLLILVAYILRLAITCVCVCGGGGGGEFGLLSGKIP